jgi:hypothetical protein
VAATIGAHRTERARARPDIQREPRFNIKRPDKAALADLIGTIDSSLRNDEGKGVQRADEGSPARWRLAS